MAAGSKAILLGNQLTLPLWGSVGPCDNGEVWQRHTLEAGIWSAPHVMLDQASRIARTATLDTDTVRKLQSDVNGQIERACDGESRYHWKAIAERIADEELSSDTWEYVMLDRLGLPPHVTITHYLR